ncbi:MAG: hypothetical protein ABI877_09330 [Gemmatimonadaceae bacterium]
MVLAIVLLLAAACDGTGVVRSDQPLIGALGGSSALERAIVGPWQRILFFLDVFGSARSSETHWQFAADGTAVRAVIARNFTDGISDVLISTARWRVEGTSVRIDFLTPSPGTIQLEARIQSDTLYLAGQAYARGSS